MFLLKIISGGQTGVDSGALRAALELSIPIDGFCPKGKINEQGVMPDEFTLKETASGNYSERTEKNVILADATLIIVTDPKLTGGTLLTKRLCQKHKKPLLKTVIGKTKIINVTDWITDKKITTLNVAGPRESNFPGIENKSFLFLKEIINELRQIQ